MPTQFQTHLHAGKKVLTFYMGYAYEILYNLTTSLVLSYFRLSLF
jgi:hypothetical protein